MKKMLFASMLVIVSYPVLSQNISYDIQGNYEHPVKLGQLTSASHLHDFIEGYPASWIKQYESVEILATSKGITKKAIGNSEALNVEQKTLLNTAELFTKFDINVSHISSNAVTGKNEVRVIKFSMTVVPNVEARYIGGSEMMKSYIKTNAIDKISAFSAEYILDGIVTFVIDVDGSVVGATLSKSTGDHITDKLLLDSIKNMPKWNPAIDANGKGVRQEFELKVSKGGC